MPKRILSAAIALALLFALAVCAQGVSASRTIVSERELPLADGTIRVTESREEDRQLRTYRDKRGICLTTVRQHCVELDTVCSLYRELLPSGSILHLYDPELAFRLDEPLTAGEYRANTAVIELPNGETRFFCLPMTFIDGTHDVILHQPELAGKLVAEETAEGIILSVIGFGDETSDFIDFTMLSSPVPLFSWFDDNWALMWDRFTNDGESLMCYSGYYRFTPDDYTPGGENCYYRCPAAFLARATRWDIGKNTAAPLVTAAILDSAAQTQNSHGFFPTAPRSGWLSRDYGIGHGFYDTRFNTDLLELLLHFRTLCGDVFRDPIARYAEFFLNFAEAHHTETKSGGWLVADYWSKDMPAEPHTSLNHQLAECQQLYRLEDDFKDPRFGALADRLLLAVEDTAADWIKPNSDLHYCRYADGSYGAQDYPDLTYKDLVLLRQYLQKFRSRSSPALDTLIDAKGKWMDANGIPR